MGAMKATLVTGVYLALQTVCSRIPTDCLSMLESCISPDLCKSDETLLRNICDSKSDSCQTQDSECCNVTIQVLFEHWPLWRRECVCTEDPCITLRLLTSLCCSGSGDWAPGSPDESSVAAQQRAVTAPQGTSQGRGLTSSLQENVKLRAEWKSSRLSGYVPGPNASCLQEMMLCIQDEVCNRHLVPFVQSCSAPRCEDSHCRLAARRFYSRLPQNVAEMLVFCRCARGEHDCQQVSSTLQSAFCSETQVPLQSCLEMLDSCVRTAPCRETFEAFLSKCFGPEDTPYSEYSTKDLIDVIDLNHFFSDDKECRKAFVATMGSILQRRCTCQQLYHHDLYKCNMVQQAIQNRSHFRLHGANRNASLQSRVNRPDPGHSQFNDQLWYVLVYIFAVLVILAAVIIIWYKLGRMHSLSKKARFNPPQDSTKSLVL
ncbi:GDNF family receptor alpha-like [Brachyhypopomus gauderio]|uniref:GDNF family receptor alpha-like n=1 Tax=Brachyhypopomus gauderio TaxID=698409 RepID=UPI004040F6EE